LAKELDMFEETYLRMYNWTNRVESCIV
jgi:hypothetical protein